jgi:hypothetical protein
MGSKTTNIFLKNITMMTCLFIVSHLAALNIVNAAISPQETPPKYVIQSSFKRNKKIWGTFHQVRETGFKLNKNGKRLKRNKVRTPLSDIIFKRGKIFFIRPSQKLNSISLEVLGLPYKKISKRTYKLFTKGHKNKLYAMFKDHIQTIITKGLYRKEKILEITINDVIFKNAICSRKRKLYKCQFPIELSKGKDLKVPMVPKDFTESFKELRLLRDIKESSLFRQYQSRLKRRLWKRFPSSKIFH